MAVESSSEKSFAERFASKKSTMTSEQLQTKQPVESQSAAASTKSFPKPQDTQKHMLAELIYLVKGIDDGRNAWYYVLVERLKVQLFLKALNDEIIHLENYGKILFSAYGDEPPAEITNALKEEYGIK